MKLKIIHNSMPRPSKNMLVQILFIAFYFIAVAMPAFGQSGDTFQISSSAITGGGSTTSNGTFSLTGSIGQSSIATAAGGGFMVIGGVFSVKASPFLFGDVTKDNKIDILDLVSLSNYLVGNIPQNSPFFNKAAADLDSNGTIDILDLVILANYLVGNTHTLPVG